MLECLLVSVLCPWNLLGRNIYVRNGIRVKLVNKTLMEIERTKKEMRMRKTKKKRKMELTENVY
jgi:hypothetical protein